MNHIDKDEDMMSVRMDNTFLSGQCLLVSFRMEQRGARTALCAGIEWLRFGARAN